MNQVWQKHPASSEMEIATSAYVHVPFCIHRCGYCDFTVVSGRDDLIPAYLDCLEAELKRSLSAPQPMQTVFIGGGTPSYLPASDLQRLLNIVREWLPLEAGGEFSIECNPEQFTGDRMDVLCEAGVNRVSLGVQSFQPQHLQTLERRHTAETVADVIRNLRMRGMDNVSLDLIFGVPGQSLAEWEKTLETAVSLRPEHISTYGLTYEKGTAFWTRREKESLVPVAEESEREMYATAMTRLPQQGYVQYELSNFARPGSESRHNRVYWKGEPYFGFGPGAASFLSGVRRMNHRSVTTWIKRVHSGESPVIDVESLEPELRRREAVMLGLRQVEGIDQDQFRKRFQIDIRELEPVAYDRFLHSGWLEETETHVRLTREGRFVADTVMSEFL